MGQGVALAVLAGAAHARVVEGQIDVPVQVENPLGQTQIAQNIRVTVWSDDTNPRPAPIALINHGRAPDAQGRASLGRARYTDASRPAAPWLCGGRADRVGYGVSGGEDVEDTRGCNNRNYPPGFDAAAVQMLQAP